MPSIRENAGGGDGGGGMDMIIRSDKKKTFVVMKFCFSNMMVVPEFAVGIK